MKMEDHRNRSTHFRLQARDHKTLQSYPLNLRHLKLNLFAKFSIVTEEDNISHQILN